MTATPPSANAFARAVERALAEGSDRPTVLSPMDWHLLTGWQARGIPLAVVLEAVEAARAPRRGRPRRDGAVRLTYVATAVEEAWGVIAGGRTASGGTPDPESADLAERRERWRAAAERAGPGSPLGRLVTDLLGSLDGGAAPSDVDAALDASLSEVAPAEVRSRVEAGTDAELRAFRSRMNASELTAVRRRTVAERLRRALGLPRLARDPGER